jgi:hypothetical protein
MSCSLLGHPDFFLQQLLLHCCRSYCSSFGATSNVPQSSPLKSSLGIRAGGKLQGPAGPTEKLRSGKREANGFNGHCWLCEFTFWWSVFAVLSIADALRFPGAPVWAPSCFAAECFLPLRGCPIAPTLGCTTSLSPYFRGAWVPSQSAVLYWVKRSNSSASQSGWFRTGRLIPMGMDQDLYHYFWGWTSM